MKYNFINQYGQIISTNNLSTIKKGLCWAMLNSYMPLWSFTKEEHEFFKKYGLYSSVWNVGVYQHLKMVYLNPTDLKRLNKGGDNTIKTSEKGVFKK